MKKAQNKTRKTGASVEAFVGSITDPVRREEVRALVSLMKRVTKAKPKMWGTSIIGFGSYYYKYGSGREGEWCITGLSPRKGSLTVYILPGLHHHKGNLKKLGKVTTGKSCIYIKKLEDIHLPTLEKMVRQSLGDIRKYTPKVSSA